MRGTANVLMSSVAILLLAAVPAAGQSNAKGDATFDREAETRHVVSALEDFMAAFNSRDVDAWEATFHFPHYRLAGGRMSVLEKPGEQDGKALFARLQAIGWHHSAWDSHQVVQLSPNKAHVVVHFSRYRADGSKLASYDSFYVLTKEDGKWGIKLRSSFAP